MCNLGQGTIRCILLLLSSLLHVSIIAAESDYKPLSANSTDTAGPHGNLDQTARRFAILRAADPLHGRLTLMIEGETKTKEWSLAPGAEVWFSGEWGRLDQFTVGDRVWVWFNRDRDKQFDRIVWLADELSEQDLYEPLEVKAVDQGADTATFASNREKKPTSRTIPLTGATFHRNNAEAPLTSLKTGEKLYLQTTGDCARLLLDAATFEKRKAAQREVLRQRWANEGLPGTLIFSYPQRHEVEVMIDHEGSSWSRTLKEGDRVTLCCGNSTAAQIKRLRPWRERTQILIGIDDGSVEPAGVAVGQRVSLRFAAVPVEVDAERPTGLGKSTARSERVEWIMSSVYCTCGMHDGCAGHVFTLAACDAGQGHTCGLARGTREKIAELIDAGQTDRQIFEAFRGERGPNFVRPHMLP